jgi:hypothetical protein
VRDVRSLLLLKIVFAERLHVDPRPMLLAQQEAIDASLRTLDTRVRASSGTERILMRFRLESTRAVQRFIDGILDDEPIPARVAS